MLARSYARMVRGGNVWGMTSHALPTADLPSVPGGFDIYHQLLPSRIVFLGQQVDDEIANKIVGQLLFLEAQDPEKDIWLYINSPGGSVTAGMAIFDTMQLVKPKIATLCFGLGASMGQFLLTAGTPGKRFALPNATILMHQPSAGIQGQAADIAIQAENLVRMKKRMATLIAERSGQTEEQITEDSDRDRWFTSEEARDYGLLDHVIETSDDRPS